MFSTFHPCAFVGVLPVLVKKVFNRANNDDNQYGVTKNRVVIVHQ